MTTPTEVPPRHYVPPGDFDLDKILDEMVEEKVASACEDCGDAKVTQPAEAEEES